VDEQRVRPRPRGRHFLAPRLAADLVRNAGITRGDLVVEIGAGTGAITRELAGRARRVVAVELDASYARRLRARFRACVDVVHADALEFTWPRGPFRVVANLPFAHTTAILHHLLDDPRTPVLRADVIVGWGFAVKRCSQRPSTALTLAWAPWFELTVTRRLRASSFTPRPSTDAAVVTITRRPDALLRPEEWARYQAFLRREFGCRPRASDLDVFDWVRLFRRG
jgi:23S rRNA (adenine-N6)-dimethyltransferase